MSAVFVVGLLGTVPLWPQQKVSPGNSYHRVLAVVPVVGKGTWNDPKRPMFAAAAASSTDRTGIIAFQQQLSDDGQFAPQWPVRAASTQVVGAGGRYPNALCGRSVL